MVSEQSLPLGPLKQLEPEPMRSAGNRVAGLHQHTDLCHANRLACPLYLQIPEALLKTPWREWRYQPGRIPYILWQSYTKSVKPPAEAMDSYWSWGELNPGLPRITHDGAAADGCVRLLFGEAFFKAYASLPMVVMKTDILRYAILYAFGGIYIDMDAAALRPLRAWLPPQADKLDWPPNAKTSVSPTWDDCSLITGLENEDRFNVWVRHLLCVTFCASPFVRHLLCVTF